MADLASLPRGNSGCRYLVCILALTASPWPALAQPTPGGHPSVGAAPSVQPGQVLQFDRVQITGKEFHFTRDPQLVPEKGPFALVESFAMSNDLGERWALVTVRNTLNSDRFLKDEHLVATFADGSQAYARNLNERLGGREVFSGSVFFGHSPFPIVQVEARTR